MTFAQFLILFLGVFLLCWTIDKAGGYFIKKIIKWYQDKL